MARTLSAKQRRERKAKILAGKTVEHLDPCACEGEPKKKVPKKKAVKQEVDK